MAIKELPEKHKQVLNDPTLKFTERMGEVEKINGLGYSQPQIANAMGISMSRFYLALKVYRQGNQYVNALLDDGWLSVQEAADAVQQAQYMIRFPFDEKWGKYDGEILYEHRPVRIWRKDGKCYISSSLFNRPFYRVDDNCFPVKVVRELIDRGYKIRSNMRVIDPEGNSVGMIACHLLAAAYGVSSEKIRNAKTIEPPSEKETQDIRICNLIFDNMNGIVPKADATTVHRVGDDIAVLCRSNGVRGYTDYTPKMWQIITTGAVHTRARDNRLSVTVGDRDYYIHHLRVALDLYGLPDEFTVQDVIAMMEQFSSAYTCDEKGLSIDHLDGDCMNNRLSNLVIMSKKLNLIKQALTTKIANLDPHFFCWAQRYDTTTVIMRAGCLSQLRAPVYWIEGVFTIKEYFEEMQRFIDMAQENESCFTEVSSKKCDIERLGKDSPVLYGYLDVAQKKAAFFQKNSEKTDRAEPDAGEDE